MASLSSSWRATARMAARQLQQQRGFRAAPAVMAAHNLAMPSLSPTMEQGNIASWKIKEGDSFSAGDVLLEVETDKATMDVEAQDDGILAKIMQSDGSKDVKVGVRIAVLADPGDDISALEIPEEDSASAPKQSKEAPKEEEPKQAEPSEPAPKKPASKPAGKGKKQTYPPYPSVQVLLHQHNLNADDIPPSGPNGRLLKGDVLAYLEQIPTSYPDELASRLSKLSHLDLSNVKPAAPKQAAKKDDVAVQTEPEPEPPVTIARPVSLTAVLHVQRKMQESLGITLPLSTFVARAIALANEDLPHARRTPSADELFDAVLGLDKARPHSLKTKDGHFVPQIIGLPDPSAAPVRRPVAKKSDLFDELVSTKKTRKAVPGVRSAGLANAVGEENIFSLSVDKEEALRAEVFLERVKIALEAEPGRLVL